MPFLILLLLLVALIYGPQIWAKRILTKYSKHRDDFPGTGGQLARHLLDQLDMSEVKVEVTELGDHYDPIDKSVRLSQANWGSQSLTAVVTAAHEVGHAIQDRTAYQPLQARSQLVGIAQLAEKIGAGLMMMIPVVAIIAHIPAAGLLMFLGGLASLGASVVVHLVTLPVEWDASFKRALPILKKGEYISNKDQLAARQILTACALTYVASSLDLSVNKVFWYLTNCFYCLKSYLRTSLLSSLLNLWRWIAILRR